MTEKQWDYEKLQNGIETLRKALSLLQTNKNDELSCKPLFELWASIEHTIEYIERNMAEGRVESPLETYINQK